MAATLLAVATMLLIGWPVAQALGGYRRPVAMGALGFLYGSGIVFMVLQAMSLLGIRWSRAPVLICCIVIATAAALVRRTHSPQPPVRLHPIDLATLALAGIYGYLAVFRPRRVGDFYGIWGLKGQLFTASGGIDWDVLSKPWMAASHPDYPVLVPLDYAFAGLLGGGWNDRGLGALTFAWFVALIVVVRELAEEETSPAAAATIAFVTGALLVFPVGGAEIPLVAFTGAALLFLRRGDPVGMRHAAVLLGLGVMTKNEGLSLLGTVIVGLMVAGRFRDALRLWPSLLIAAPWLVAVRVHGLANDLTQGSPMDRLLHRLADPGPLVSLLWEYLDAPAVTVAIGIALLIGVRRERFMVTALTGQLLIFVAVYAATPHPLRWHVGNSWDRLVLQVIVPAAYPALIVLWRLGHREPILHSGTRADATSVV